jgi:hypothetical protein
MSTSSDDWDDEAVLLDLLRARFVKMNDRILWGAGVEGTGSVDNVQNELQHLVMYFRDMYQHVS